MKTMPFSSSDEIQSGFGRSGKIFAHQNAGVTPDIIAMAKGMEMVFLLLGILISPKFKASYGFAWDNFWREFPSLCCYQSGFRGD